MPKVTTLVCDDCSAIADIDPTVIERGDAILCDTCAEVRRRRTNGEAVFGPTESYSTSREEINYDNAYPSLDEAFYTAEFESPLEVHFLGETLTPEQALEIIGLVKGVSAEDFGRPSWGAHKDIDWTIRITWRGVPIDIVEDAADEFLKPALGLIDPETGLAVDPPWLVPQTQISDEAYDGAGRLLPRGRCDTCGAPCDDQTGACTTDATHEVALP